MRHYRAIGGNNNDDYGVFYNGMQANLLHGQGNIIEMQNIAANAGAIDPTPPGDNPVSVANENVQPGFEDVVLEGAEGGPEGAEGGP